MEDKPMKQSEQAARLLAILTALGAEGAQVQIRESEKHILSMSGGEIDTLATDHSSTASLKLQKGLAFVEKSYTFGSEAEFPALAESAMAELDGAPEDPDDAIFPQEEEYAVSDLRSSFDPAAMTECLSRLRADIASVGAVLNEATLSYEVRRTALTSTNGTRYAFETDGYQISYAAVLEQDGKTVDPFRGHCGFRKPQDFRFDTGSLLVQNASMLFAQKKCEPFTGSLLIAPQSLYYLLMDHFFAQLFEDSLLSGGSAWSESFGKQVCDPRFSASMDPAHPDVAFGERITQDGCRAKPYDLIRNGILQNAIAGQKPARMLKIPPSGNTADNLVLPAGETPLSELLRQTEKGVLVFSFGGDGSPDGSFSGVASVSFLVENGKIVCALEDCPVSGNWFTILSEGNFTLSRERVSDGEYVLPWMKIENITFS